MTNLIPTFDGMCAEPAPSTLTRLIHGAQRGETGAMDALFEAAYPDLRRLARSRLRAGYRPTLLDTGSLVNESYVRFASSRLALEDRAHFMCWAARVMRSIIVDYTRQRLANRRGGGSSRVPLDVEPEDRSVGEEEILAVHEALGRLAEVDPRLVRVVEMRYFGGLTEPEVADALGVTERTVRRDWQKARLLLHEALV
ncbi:MAG: ECF-type sigma factor [Acidobacteriota bacterium]|nr:ECF-type sigma factor [Acidobacteriota bacterium]